MELYVLRLRWSGSAGNRGQMATALHGGPSPETAPTFPQHAEPHILRADNNRTNPVARFSVRTFACLVAAAAFAPLPAAAQTDFYRGKQISILIAGTAGGGIDLGARILSKYLGKYLPGNPTIVPQLMPGGGGIRMIDYMHTVAAKDGTVIGITPPGPIIEPLIGKRQATYRMTDFVSIGAMNKDTSLCVSWGASKFKTIQDAMKEQMVVAGTGAGASPDIYPVVLNTTLHTKF